MKVGIVKEIYPNECRVAATPDTVSRLQKLGFEVLIESGAGQAANFQDQLYVQAGAECHPDPQAVWTEADILIKVRPPMQHPQLGQHEADWLQPGKTLISFIWPAQNQPLLDQLAAHHVNVLAMDAIPRITRAQKMDALSSMANIAGYRAVIEAANHFDRFFPGQITAAGKVPPAKILIIGAGVAGLAALGAARNLGAIVRAFDTRPAVKEQVESLGGEFLELEFAEDGTGQGGYAKVMSEEFIKAEMALFADQAKDVDVIITTALIPGVKAPVLITREMVESMKPGSVVVDLAAEQGGNCEVTRPGESYSYQGVHIIGYTDLPSRMAQQASQLYGTNLYHFLDELGGNKPFNIDLDNEVIRGALVLHEGKLMWPPPKPAAQPAPQPATQSAASSPASPAPVAMAAAKVSPATSHAEQPKAHKPNAAHSSPEDSGNGSLLWPILAGLALVGVGISAPPSFLSHFTVFVLACFVGWQVIWNVKPALHTPLMSVTNAISGIIIIGGILQVAGSLGSPSAVLGAIAIFIGTINISGGFLVTQRMLKMFQR
jgi:H+-translocating NAD(P) transhydrogenase subunit alpha